MGPALARVLPLALGAAVSPTVLAVLLLLLGSENRPRARGAAFAAGAMAMLAAITAALLPILHALDTRHGAQRAAWDWTDIGLGVLLVLIGLRAVTRRGEPAPPKPPHESGLATDAALGAGMMLANLSTLVLYVAALKEIALAGTGTGGKAALLLVLYAVTTMLIWVPLLIDTAVPRTADRVLGSMNRWLRDHRRAVGAAVCFAFGAYLIVKGVRGL